MVLGPNDRLRFSPRWKLAKFGWAAALLWVAAVFAFESQPTAAQAQVPEITPAPADSFGASPTMDSTRAPTSDSMRVATPDSMHVPTLGSTADPRHIAMPDPVEGRVWRSDRAQHAGLSFALVAGLTTADVDPAPAGIAVLGLGLAKELYDARGGHASALDLAADLAGIALGIGLALALDL